MSFRRFDDAWNMESTASISGRVKMPLVGFGTYKVPAGTDTENIVMMALEAGYRHIDTAELYANEEGVGNAIKRFCRTGAAKREDLFVTSKMWTMPGDADAGEEAGTAEAVLAVSASLNKLKLDYIDLYLLHSPHNANLRVGRWKGLEQCLAEGKLRSIGVSNFGRHHVEELLAKGSVPPAVNQLEFHCFLQRTELIQFCQDHGIQVVAYSPLAKARRLDHPALVEMQTVYNKTPAQLMLRYCLQRGAVVLPKASSIERMKENADIFGWSLTDEDMASLSALDENMLTGWDPTVLP